MAERKVEFVEGEYYHVYNRGNSKQKIFHSERDYQRFLQLLYVSNDSDRFKIPSHEKEEAAPFTTLREHVLVSIVAYCIMPNHFHILLTPVEDNGISKFMQKLSTAYVMYYNKKHDHTGSLFEGKFKSEHADNDRYLKYLFSYIHLNPVKLIDPTWREKGIRNKRHALSYASQYKFSSLPDYIGAQRKFGVIIDQAASRHYFSKKEDVERELLEWITYV